MLDYFSKIYDALDMLWTSFGYMERYYTMVILIWLGSLIVRLLWRRDNQRVLIVRSTETQADPQES